jgi:N-acetylmuramoyl-L-alanine amidase-like protein
MDAAEVARILTDAGAESDIGTRIDRISAFFLGRSYIEGSLGGGPELPEEFRVFLGAFDCVTYIETVLALALARTIDEFIDTIRHIRYKDGEIDWFRRNHYMVDWSRSNEESGFIRNITKGPHIEEKMCTLSMIPGLPVRTTIVQFFPTTHRAVVASLAERGDLILFVSTRQTLDVFHAGVLIDREGCLFVRHSGRTAGQVIEQNLDEFIRQNEMAGYILLRPLCRH